ncbi:DUF3888 domain-containing protein [Gottfriedia sp. NPDC058432]|uniref:DUF3888 domain-containing protein n=1 Tax=Gottfriedia sp. NPDC058432 TaxID=3346497 RepID=UPI003665F669
MKKIVSIIFVSVLFFTGTSAYAVETREDILEDAVIDLLQPQLNEVIKDHYGTTYNISTFCEKVNDIKKLRHPGSRLFEAKLEFATFTGAHNIKDIFTVTLKKDWEDRIWMVKEYRVHKLKPNDHYDCRVSRK